MPKYNFKAVDLNNKTIKGTFIASDDDDLKNIISNQNYYLISYKKVAESSQMFSFLEKIKTDDFTMFCRQFSIMLNAGLNIDKTVMILKTSTKNQKLKSILEVVYTDLMKGKMLSESFGKYPKTFPVFFRNMVAIGELSGHLDIVFIKLADYYDNDAKTKKKVKAALAYPLFLVGIAFAALAVISLFVMPQFATMFADFDADLPKVSQIVIDVTGFVKNYFKEILIGVFLVIVVMILLGKVKTIRRFYDKMKLSIPMLKGINIAMVTSRFTNGFSVLLNSGMQLLDSMNVISKLLGNKIVEEKLQVVKNEISVGKGIAKSLETINIFPNMLIEMISVGENTGSLEEVLDRITVYFDDQVNAEIKKLIGAIEPVMIMIIGIIVVVVMLAIFMPMMDLMSAIENVG